MKKLMLKKTNIWFMVIIFLFTAIIPMISLGTTALAEDERNYPNIVTSIVGNNELQGGETGELTIKIENSNPLSYGKSISFMPVNKSPFVFIKPITKLPFETLTSSTPLELILSIEVDKYAANGVYPLEFVLEYVDPWNQRQTTNHTLQVKVINNKTNAKLVLQPGKDITVDAGSSFELPLEVKNLGDLNAKDIRISFDPSTNFTLVSGNNSINLDTILGGASKKITYSLRAASLESGSYPISFRIEYTDEKNSVISDQQTIWIPVKGVQKEDTKVVLEVLEIKTSQTNMKPGESFDVFVNIKNSGSANSGQIRITADGTDILLPVSQNLQIIQSIAKGESKSVKFSFQPKPNAPRGGVPVMIKVEPVDESNGAAISQAISVFVDAEATPSPTPDPSKSVPKIIIKSYTCEPNLVKAGENFELSMQFINTNSTREVRNIKGSFSVSEGSNEMGNVFTPVGSSNTFYIDKISPQQTANWNITLYTIPDAKSKTYTMSISFEYEDDLGVQHSATEIIGVPVYQPSRFDISDIVIPAEVYMGNPVYIAFEMYNLGKTDLYNVKLDVEGDFNASPKSNYFGNFESGKVEYFELNLTPTMVGQANGRLIFQYESANGDVHQVIEEISMNVMDMYIPPEGEFPVDGIPMEPGIEDLSKSVFAGPWLYMILGAIVVIVVVTIVLVKRKKRKDKEFEF